MKKKHEKKSKKTSKIATFRHFWGPLKGRSYRHKKPSHVLKIVIRFARKFEKIATFRLFWVFKKDARVGRKKASQACLQKKSEHRA